MQKSRRTLLGAALAACAAPPLVGRAWAALPGQPLPIPTVVSADASGITRLTAIEATHRFLDSRATPTRGFDQPFLGPVLRVRRGATARLDVQNQLSEALTVHWHGLHVPGSVDGGPHQEIARGARWAVALEIDQPATTAWYHSHVHGRTGAHVNAGLAGMLIVDDPAVAAGNLPSNYGIDDVPLIVQDRAFGRDGRMLYSNAGPARMMGFRGDHILVNGALRPLLRVPPGIVRLRLLNGCNARIVTLRFEDGRPMHLIGSDGGLLARPVARTSLTLSTGERAEVLVDFGRGAAVRLLSAPDRNSPMGGMMGGGMMGLAEPPAVGEGGAFEVLSLEVDAALPVAHRSLPEHVNGAAPAPAFGEPVRRRSFVLDTHMMGGGMGGMGGMGRGGRGGGMGMMGGFTINGRAFDMARIDQRVRRGELESWQVRASDMAHPFHLHGASFQVVSRNGRTADFASTGWKDTLLVEGEAELLVRLEHRADEHTPYMFHCHILEHEDAGMMGQFTVT